MTFDAASILARVRLHRLDSPANFYPLAGRMVPWCGAIALALALVALATGLWIVPAGAVSGDTSGIVYIHVPAAWMSLFVYVLMAGCAALALANVGVPALMMTALAPTGAMFSIVALWTGLLWGKPAWGDWWVWDARLTCELILLMLYVGFMSLRALFDDQLSADRASATFVLVGLLNIPIIYYSLSWWKTTPHQGVAASLLGSPKMPPPMLAAMLTVAMSFWMYANAVMLTRVRCMMLERRACSDEGVVEDPV